MVMLNGAIYSNQSPLISSGAKGSWPGLSEPAANKPEANRGQARGQREVQPVQAPTQGPGGDAGAAQLTPGPRQPPAGYVPAQSSPLIPVLLPQQRGGGPYAVYLHASSLRPHTLSRPQPTSLAVRSMTFEDKTGQSPGPQPLDLSPSATKRVSPDTTSEGSPSKAKRVGGSFKVCQRFRGRAALNCGSFFTLPSHRYVVINNAHASL